MLPVLGVWIAGVIGYDAQIDGVGTPDHKCAVVAIMVAASEVASPDAAFDQFRVDYFAHQLSPSVCSYKVYFLDIDPGRPLAAHQLLFSFPLEALRPTSAPIGEGAAVSFHPILSVDSGMLVLVTSLSGQLARSVAAIEIACILIGVELICPSRHLRSPRFNVGVGVNRIGMSLFMAITFRSGRLAVQACEAG
jgi:hypothetical protein